MTIVTHNVVGFLLVLTLIGQVARVGHRVAFRTGTILALVGGGVVLLSVAGVTNAMLYRGDNFGRVQVLAWTIFLHLPLFLFAIGATLRPRLKTAAVGLWIVSALWGLAGIYAFKIEPTWLDVSRLTLSSPKIAEPVRVVVLADVQTDRAGAYEARVFETAMAQQPDLVLFAGDYVHLGRRSEGYEVELDRLRDAMVEAGLSAPLGIYAIAGNVDRPGIWTQLFEGLSATTVETTSRYDLGPLVLTGLGMDDAFGRDVVVAPEAKFHIVLGHSPNFSLAPVAADLLIAGHTHGGQVQLPFIGPLMTLSVVPRDWASGVTEIEPDKTLIVSRGIGLERANAPRLRFLCRPELVVIDLIPE